MEKVERNTDIGIDIGKFVCAILILISHMGPFESYSLRLNYWIVNLSFRFVVPFFFVCSGFFSYRTYQNGKIKKYLLRIISLYLLWTLIYIAFNLPYTVDWNIIYQILVRGSRGHLWYFPSLIFSMVFVYGFLIKLNRKVSGVICIFLYILGLLGDSYAKLLQYFPGIDAFNNLYMKIFGATRNGILFPTIYIFIGILLAENWERPIANLKKINYAVLFITSYFLFVGELFTITKIGSARDINLYFTTIPMAAFLFLLLKDICASSKELDLLIRRMSTVIYCSHMLVVQLMDKYIFVHFAVNSLRRCVIVILITVIVSYALVCLSKRIKCLRHLY